MSEPPLLLLIADRGAAPDRMVANAEPVLSHWPDRERPRLKAIDAARLESEPDVLEQAAVAWFMMEETGGSDLYELVGLAQERHLPTAITRAGDEGTVGQPLLDGAVRCPPATPAAQTHAVLRALASQTPALRELSHELEILRNHHGGLCGQIDRIDEELRLAAQLQREFLPGDLPPVHDVDFAALWRPASYVSGDIYDVLRLDEEHVGVFLADVVGHGVPAALMTMFIKRALHTKRIDRDLASGYRLLEPAEALAWLNRDLLQRQSERIRFATACYGVINCRTLEMRLARAGHPHPMLLHHAGPTERIAPEGGLLGVFPEEVFELEQATIQLEPGDRLLLYSDGFELAFPGEAGGSDKVATDSYWREFEDLREGPIHDALERLRHKLDEQTGSLNQQDDLTIVSLNPMVEPCSAPGRNGFHAAPARAMATPPRCP